MCLITGEASEQGQHICRATLSGCQGAAASGRCFGCHGTSHCQGGPEEAFGPCSGGLSSFAAVQSKKVLWFVDGGLILQGFPFGKRGDFELDVMLQEVVDMDLDETVGAASTPDTAAAQPPNVSQAQATPATTKAPQALLSSQCVSCFLF